MRLGDVSFEVRFIEVFNFGVLVDLGCMKMMLGQISYLDCLVFLIFLAPQLLIQINVLELAVCIVQALPFLCKFCEIFLLESAPAELTSLRVAIPIHSRALLHAQERQVAVCEASNAFSGLCNSLRSLCLRLFSSEDWAGVLFERRCSSFHEVSYATAWLPALANTMAGGRP